MNCLMLIWCHYPNCIPLGNGFEGLKFYCNKLIWVWIFNIVNLTYVTLMFHFYTPWKRQKTRENQWYGNENGEVGLWKWNISVKWVKFTVLTVQTQIILLHCSFKPYFMIYKKQCMVYYKFYYIYLDVDTHNCMIRIFITLPSFRKLL